MYKGTIYKCDNCGSEIISDKGIPNTWFQFRLEMGSSVFNEDTTDSGCISEGDYCCSECVLRGIETSIPKVVLLMNFNPK